MRTFALYSFDFGATPLNDRSPQAVLNKALASRTTLDLLNLRGFLFNVLFSLRKLPRIDSSTHKNLCLYAPVRADSVFGGFPLRTLLTAAPTFRLTQPKHCSNSGNASSIELLGSLEELCPDCAREVQAREAQMLMGCVFVAPAFAYAFTDEDEALDALQKPEPFYSAVKDPEFVGTLITISGPNVWCYDIEPYSVFPAQSRVILEPDRMFRIVSVAFENKLRRITVEMLNTPVLLCDLIPPQIQQRTFSPEPQPQLPQQQPQQVSQKPTTSKAPVSPRKQQQQQQQQPSPPASQTTTQPVHTETAKGTTTTVVNNATTSSDNSQQKEKCISPDPKQQQAQQNVQTTPAKQAKSEESVPPNNITNNEAPKEPEAGKAAEEQPAVVVDCGNGKETRGRADEEVEGNDRKEINDLLALIVDKKSKARGIVANVCKELYSKVSDEENSEKNQIIFVTANGIQGLLETFKRFSPFDRDIFLNMCFVFSYVIKEKCNITKKHKPTHIFKIYVFINTLFIYTGASESIFIESDGVSTVLAGYESFYADPECCRLMTNAISMFFFESKISNQA